MLTTATKSVKDILNLRQNDTLCCYGINSIERDVMDDLSKFCSVSAIALDKVEQIETEKARSPYVYTFEGMDSAVESSSTFDKVLCHYPSVPKSLRSPKHVLESCYNLCRLGGMGLVTGLTDEKDAEAFEAKHYIVKWILSKNDRNYDLLFKKQRY